RVRTDRRHTNRPTARCELGQSGAWTGPHVVLCRPPPKHWHRDDVYSGPKHQQATGHPAGIHIAAGRGQDLLRRQQCRGRAFRRRRVQYDGG
ncbi:hypothetical protein A1O1_05169, partial [Capronia coronata CBS 617.96]